MKITDLEIQDFSSLPKRIMQFGEGNFLRAFADYFIQNANERGIINSSVVLVKPIAGEPNPDFKNQNFRYNVFLRGRMNGEVVDDVKTITSVSDMLSAYDDFDKMREIAKSPELQFIISNTTEAGIEFNAADEFSLCLK
jgi:tagaturonate reductase